MARREEPEPPEIPASDDEPSTAAPRARNWLLLAVVALLVVIVLTLRICPSLRDAAKPPPRPAPHSEAP